MFFFVTEAFRNFQKLEKSADPFPGPRFYFCSATHCYKTLRRIPPPWPDGAGPNGQGRGKWLLYMVRVFPCSGTWIFQHFSKSRNFPEIYMIISQKSSFPMLVFYIPRCRKTFPEFSGDYPVKKWKSAHDGIERRISGLQLYTSTSTPQLPYKKIFKI